MVSGARELLELGVDAFASPTTERFVAEVGRHHPARALYTRATAEAIERSALPGVDSEATAEEVFSNFIWTHFVCKLLMTAAPEVTADFVTGQFDMDAVAVSLDTAGPGILSCFHYAAYPLVALGLAMSTAAPLISKARLDVIEQSATGLDDHVVYLSNRSAAVRLTRALRGGRSVWVLLDVVLPSVRVVRAEFLGHAMHVGAGLGKIARLSERPCIPLFWELHPERTPIRTALPVPPTLGSEEEIVQAFVDTQAAFISQQPSQWLEWYSVLGEAPRLRAEVKHGNEVLWQRLSGAFG
jgi:lauroyl/myristoyl acyltransferase